MTYITLADINSLSSEELYKKAEALGDPIAIALTKQVCAINDELEAAYLANEAKDSELSYQLTQFKKEFTALKVEMNIVSALLNYIQAQLDYTRQKQHLNNPNQKR